MTQGFVVTQVMPQEELSMLYSDTGNATRGVEHVAICHVMRARGGHPFVGREKGVHPIVVLYNCYCYYRVCYYCCYCYH